MTVHHFPTDSPGVRLDQVMAALDSDAVTQLLGAHVLGALQLLHTQPSLERVRAVAAELIDFEALARDPDKLRLILDVLPEYKQAELAQRLDVSIEQLRSLTLDSLSTRVLAGFFGVRLDHKIAQEAAPRNREVRPNYSLFEHQRDVRRRTQEYLYDHLAVKPAALMHMPTGSGKTRTASDLVCRHLAQHEPTVVLWLANTRELLDQAAAELEVAWSFLGNRGINMVRFWGDAAYLDEIDDGVVVAGLQKMYSMLVRQQERVLSLAKATTLVIVDEAHISLAPTYRRVIDLIRRRPDVALLGLSATPGRTWNEPSIDKLLADVYGGNKVNLTINGYDNPVAYLMDHGYLARPTFKLLDLEGEVMDAGRFGQPPSLTEVRADYDLAETERFVLSAAYLAGVVRAVEHLIADRHDRILVFAASVAHAVDVAALLRGRGASAEVVTGETPTARRAAIIERFKDRAAQPRVLINYGVLTTGFDAPRTSAAVIARPTRSLVLYSQMVGRSIRGRKAGGNDAATILTVVDPELPGFGSVAAAFKNWEDVW